MHFDVICQATHINMNSLWASQEINWKGLEITGNFFSNVVIQSFPIILTLLLLAM